MDQRILSWSDVEALLEHLLPQFYGSFDAMLMMARGGIIPGGMIAERLGLTYLLTAAVSFPADISDDLPTALADRYCEPEPTRELEQDLSLRGMPHFTQFPPDSALCDRRVLVVNHVWNHGRAMNAVSGRVLAAGGKPELCVLHFKPACSIFPDLKPDYYAAVTDEFIVYPWEAAHRLRPYRPMTVLR